MQIIRSLFIALVLAYGVVARDLASLTNQADLDGPKRRRQGRGTRAIAQLPKKAMNMKRGPETMMTGSPYAMKTNGRQQGLLRKRLPAAGDDEENYEDSNTIDFVIAGFPKCGTTTLLKAFGAHEETDIAASEQCVLAAPLLADANVFKVLDNTVATLDPNKKRSFKCPTTLYSYKSLTRLQKHSPGAKYVIGMRHPVDMIQSFYNYRITEIKERRLDEPIPSLEEIRDSGKLWKGVSMQSARYELFLVQLGKTDVSAMELEELAGLNHYDLAVKPIETSIFLYTIDQIEDENEERSHNFRATMQEFLGLTKPIQPFGHENTNHAVGDSAHAESIRICDPQWAEMRQRLVEQGAHTAKWLREHFIHSQDVFVANPEHFIETLESWGTDPCAEDTTA